MIKAYDVNANDAIQGRSSLESRLRSPHELAGWGRLSEVHFDVEIIYNGAEAGE